MKAVNNIFLALVLTLVNFSFAVANDLPEPEAASKSSGTLSTNGNVEEDLPINQGLVYLMAAGMTLGFTIIYNKKIKKASI